MKQICKTRNRSLGLVPTLLLLCLAIAQTWAQTDSQNPPLGDVAKKTRNARASKDHVTAKRVLDEETVPHANWHKHTASFLVTIPATKLTVAIPVPNRSAEFGYEVPIGESVIYIPFGETSWTNSFNSAAQDFFTMLLSRGRFRGMSLKLGDTEDTTIDDRRAILVHFTFVFRSIPHDGIALFIGVPEQVTSMGCMYRSVDWEKAKPMCEDVIRSSEVEIPAGDYTTLRKTW